MRVPFPAVAAGSTGVLHAVELQERRKSSGVDDGCEAQRCIRSGLDGWKARAGRFWTTRVDVLVEMSAARDHLGMYAIFQSEIPAIVCYFTLLSCTSQILMSSFMTQPSKEHFSVIFAPRPCSA